MQVAVRIDRAVSPSTSVPLCGEYVPLAVSTDQSSDDERIRSMDLVTVDLSPQNGHSADVLLSSGVRSRSPSPPDHTHSSSCGLRPEKEKNHSFFAKSTTT